MKIYEEYVVTLRSREPVEISEDSLAEEASETPSGETWYWIQRAEYVEADLRGAELEIELLEEQLEEARGLAQQRSQWWSDYWRKRIYAEGQTPNISY